MADQASVRAGNDRSGNVLGSLSEFGNDVATLAELQAQLTALDFKESAEKAAAPLGLIGVALGLLLGSVPVLLVGIALAIASWLNVEPGAAIIGVAVVTMVGAGAVLLIVGKRLPHAFESFRRSREEFVRNLSWIRTVLVYSGRTVPRRGS